LDHKPRSLRAASRFAPVLCVRCVSKGNMANSGMNNDLFRQWDGQVVPRSFNAGFVTLSFVVSLLGAASTLELINRRTAAKGKFNQ